MKNLKKKACKVLSVALSIMMTASAFTGFATTNVGAATAVDNSGNFIYTDLEDGTVEITGCIINGDVEIPSEIDGKKVTSIGEYAFKDGTTSVSIPETVVTIQDYAFYECYSLDEVEFSEGLKYVGEYAFYNCNLQKLDFPETLEEIDDYSFYNNYNIYEFSFPESHGVKIGYCAFDKGSWYWENPDGPIISGKTFLYYKCYGSYIEEYTIPDGIESINSYAFSDLYSTSIINIPDTVKYIGAGAFSYTSIKEIVIPYGVESIEESTFYGCYQLSEITIPDTVTYIGNYAFENCEQLPSSFTIPENVTYIGNYAFSSSGISELVLPENNKITYVGGNAFTDTNWYNTQPVGHLYMDDIFVGIKTSSDDTTETVIESVDIEDGTKLVASNALNGFTGSISIPDSVKYINDYAFAYTNVTQDDIPANVVEIGAGAFEGCLNITELTVPQNLKTIGENAFSSCENLATVTMSNSVTSIGDYAFSSTALVTFPIGSGLQELGYCVFENCNSLDAFTVKSDNKYFSAKNGILYNKDQTVIICYPPAKKDTKLVITADTLDYTDAFSCGNTYINEIVISEGVLTIPSYAFSNLPNIEKITIPTTVKKIGEQIFSSDSALNTVNYNAVDSSGYHAFYYCENLTTVNMGSSVTKIPEALFEKCSNLANVNLSGNIEYIGDNAFNNTPWDESIRSSITEGIVYVDKVAYSGVNLSGDVTVKDGTKSIYANAFENESGITSITLPDSVEYIGTNAFIQCTQLQSIDMSSNIKYIDDYAFYYCESLPTLDLGDNLTYLGNYAFYFCSALESIAVPTGVKFIGDYTFHCCSNLKNVTLNEGIKYIGEYAFSGTYNLESIKLPSTVEYIEYEAFYTSGIKNLELNEGLEAIHDSAFIYCNNLESVKCPSTLKKLEYNAFRECTSLQSVTLNEGLVELGSDVFYRCTSLKSIEIPSTLKTIPYNAFYCCTSLESVTLNEGLKAIDGYAFYNCSALKSIEFPSTLKSIEYDAFSNCTLLKNVTLNEGLVYLGYTAFYNTAIESIEIPSTVTELYNSFNSCANLKSVTLNEGLEYIYCGAFSDCPLLTELFIPASVNDIDWDAFDKNMTLYGYEYSYTQMYVDYHWYNNDLTHTFVSVEKMMGDVDGNGVVNVSDATTLQKYLAEMTELNALQYLCADVTDNGSIDVKDVSYIMKALVGVCEL